MATNPIAGIIAGWRRNPHSRIEKIIFHVPNFRRFRGEPIRLGGSSWTGRAEFSYGDWKITIDAVGDKDQEKELKATGGFAITHVGCVEHVSGNLFMASEAEKTLESLTWFLTFCNGRWTGPAFYFGYDGESNLLFHEWSIPRITPFQRVRSWFSDLRQEILPRAYPGFAKKWSDQLWSDTIRRAIYWYNISNAPGVAIENGVILSSLAFEALGWTLLVEDTKALSSSGYDGLPAADKLRLLLKHCGIALSIPPKLTSLEAVAKADNWRDGPEAISAIRNAHVHSSPKNRQRLSRAGKPAEYEAWMLSLYYLELILLYLLEYQGEFSSRLVNKGWLGTEVEQVPWN